MNKTEHEIRKKYRYSNLSCVFDVYIECEYRANLTKEEYEGLKPGEFRFDYKSWERRLGFSHRQVTKAIKELTTENIVIIQVEKGKKGTSSKYFLSRFINDYNDTIRNKPSDIKRLDSIEEQNSKKGQNEGQKQGQNEGQKAIRNKPSDSKDLNSIEEQNEGQKVIRNSVHSSQYNNLNIISNNIYSANAEQFAQQIWSLYPKKKGKKIAMESIKNILKKHSVKELEMCVNRYSAEVRLKEDEFILNGSTFFKGRYIDFLDENYEEKEVNTYKGFNNFQPREYDYENLEKKLLEWNQEG